MTEADAYRIVWTIVVGSLGATACALLGCFLILKRLSMLGDAISHGVLPGIALAVLVSGQVGGVAMIIGAMLFGVLTVVLTEWLSTAGNVSEDASLGVVFTSLFAAGVVIIAVFLPRAHIDTDCVLYGNFTNVPLDTFTWSDSATGIWSEIPRAAPPMLASLALTVGFIALFWKELKLAAFDAALASAMGFSAALLHYLFVALVAACSVTTFEAMGSILVLAMLVVPPATAHLLTDRLWAMLVWAAGLAVSSATFGYALASQWVFNTNVAGMIATVAGTQFALAVVLAPRHGILVRFLRQWRLALRIAGEEILGSLYRHEEAGRVGAAVSLHEHRLSPWIVALAFARLRRRGWIERLNGGWRLTAAGKHEALSVVRSHRLWETFLGKEFELPIDHLHAPAARMEHFIGPQMQEELAAQLQEPHLDPHGKQIPSP
ncbi:MAG: metal ABC transporter permease [Gemmataceae bacterium]|nr:metal ABC transporter permease [Gemmataceae bacterium]